MPWRLGSEEVHGQGLTASIMSFLIDEEGQGCPSLRQVQDQRSPSGGARPRQGVSHQRHCCRARHGGPCSFHGISPTLWRLTGRLFPLSRQPPSQIKKSSWIWVNVTPDSFFQQTAHEHEPHRTPDPEQPVRIWKLNPGKGGVLPTCQHPSSSAATACRSSSWRRASAIWISPPARVLDTLELHHALAISWGNLDASARADVSEPPCLQRLQPQPGQELADYVCFLLEVDKRFPELPCPAEALQRHRHAGQYQRMLAVWRQCPVVQALPSGDPAGAGRLNVKKAPEGAPLSSV